MPEQTHSLDAIVLAAGLGTRMKSSLPKMMHHVLGRPMVSYPVEAALSLGATRVVVVLSPGSAEIERYLTKRFSTKIFFAEQATPKGTADAVRSALPVLEDSSATSLLILNGDIPLIRAKDIKTLWKDASKTRLSFATFLTENPSGYGRVIREGDKVLGVVEEKDATPKQRLIKEVNAGVYLGEREFIHKALTQIRAENVQKEFYLPDLISLAKKDGGTQGILIEPEAAFGVNDRVELARAENIARERRNRSLMQQGVTLIDPARTYVSAESQLAEDVTLAPGVSIRGKSVIASGVTIGEGCIIEESQLGEGSKLKPYCVLDRAILDKEVVVGPFAHLRPGAHLSKQVRVGNFVEVKNTYLGKGSKANHLSYLGDAEIGEACNVGAGTITCNYDGVSKSKTVIKDGVFIGSDVQLVAPVTVGEGAVIGAGSCIGHDVPPKALAITRAKQENREEGATRYWAKRRK